MTTTDLAAAVDRMERHAIAVRLAELGRQLAVAAALQLAYRLGSDIVVTVAPMGGVVSAKHTWTPGCGRSAS